MDECGGVLKAPWNIVCCGNAAGMLHFRPMEKKAAIGNFLPIFNV